MLSPSGVALFGPLLNPTLYDLTMMTMLLHSGLLRAGALASLDMLATCGTAVSQPASNTPAGKPPTTSTKTTTTTKSAAAAKAVTPAPAQAAQAPAPSATVLDDFESAPTFRKEGSVVDEFKCEVVKDPTKEGNQVLKMNWPKHTSTHVACNYENLSVQILDTPGTYKISVRVNIEQLGSECRNMALRVVDARNETFQFSVPFEKLGEPGWTEVTWELNTATPDTGGVASWGETVDGTMDFPVRLLGVAIGFTDRATDGGTILMDDFRVAKESK
ncbi:MAG TPA: hypothetical protein VK970_21935 [Candidatus Methylacidiphilales bacterium]|nr:hypothetical protein [Candidatus Methylacidiphilales bacterium]